MASAGVMQSTEIDRFPLPSVATVLLWLQLPLLAVVIWCGAQWLTSWLHQPLQDVTVKGELQNTEPKGLRLAVWQMAKGSYLHLDLAAIKQRLEAEPWVYQVDIQRQWPNSLAVDVIEQKPVARWSDSGLLNSEGKVFIPASIEAFAGLPMLEGPEKRALAMMQQYRAMNEVVRPLQLNIVSLQLEERGAWTLLFQNGIELRLGRGQLIEKLRRFSQVYGAQLINHRDKIAAVDARYTNGLTVEWKPDVLAQPDVTEK